jgi:hypothetical protein
MTLVSVVTPEDGELIELGPARIRILEDRSTTGHRLGLAEIVLARARPGRPSTGTPGTTRASTSYPAQECSPWARPSTPPLRERW